MDAQFACTLPWIKLGNPTVVCLAYDRDVRKFHLTTYQLQ